MAPPTISVLRGLSPAQVECVVLQAADGLLVLDSLHRIRAVQLAGTLSGTAGADWIGEPLSAVVCPATRAKLDAILRSDACSDDPAARWRHVNLQRPPAEALPVLVKCLVIDAVPVLLVRDLRPTFDLQARFQRAMIELEQSYQRLTAPPLARGGRDPSGVARAVVDDMLAAVGTRPLHQIVTETAQVLERLCIRQALDLSPGDSDAAARLLGVTRSDLDRMKRSN